MKIPPYELPPGDEDLLSCGVVLSCGSRALRCARCNRPPDLGRLCEPCAAAKRAERRELARRHASERAERRAEAERRRARRRAHVAATATRRRCFGPGPFVRKPPACAAIPEDWWGGPTRGLCGPLTSLAPFERAPEWWRTYWQRVTRCEHTWAALLRASRCGAAPTAGAW